VEDVNVTEKGYVQFHCHHQRTRPPAGALVNELCLWRNRLWQAGLVGVGADGIGFGNVSVRTVTGFLITGTGTGGVASLGPERLTEVTSWDVAGNRVVCSGPVVASSEALTHGAVYAADPSVDAVVHVHHGRLWGQLLDRVPTTEIAAEAGTPAMGFAIARLFRDSVVGVAGLVVMGGHPDGLLAFGPTLDVAARHVLDAVAAA
jgi:L-ribulose-5-phosphate 4-epimerase